MTPQEAESKYKNTRTGFGRYLRRAKSVPSCSGRDAVPGPKEFANLEWFSVQYRTQKDDKQPEFFYLEGDPTDSEAGEILSVTTEDTEDPLSDHSNDDNVELSEQGLFPAGLDNGDGLSEAIPPSTHNSNKPNNSTPETQRNT